MTHLPDCRELRSRSDYLAALDELDALLATGPDTPEGRRFDELVTLIEAWEARHDPLNAARRWASGTS